MDPTPHQEQQPNLLDFKKKNVWREVDNGRWRDLSRVQKSMFVVQMLFWVVFSLGIAFESVYYNGLLRFAADFCFIAAILGAFFFILRRYLR